MSVSGVARPTPTSVTEVDRLVRPAVLAAERVLPVDAALHGILPHGLPRGVTVTVAGGAARSFALALTAAASRAGSWLATVGLPGLGWQAAAESGVSVARVVVVDGTDAARNAECIAAALDGFDFVLIGAQVRLGPGVERRLSARARERGSVLVGVHDPWTVTPRTAPHAPTRPPRGGWVDGADLRAVADGSDDGNGADGSRGGWTGIGDGSSPLGARRVRVVLEGKRLPGRRRQSDLWLPGPHGEVQAIEPMADVVSVDRRGTTPVPGPTGRSSGRR